MREKSKNQFGHLKNKNKQKVFNALIKDGELSRVNIAKKTLLSPASVTTIVENLLKEQYIREVGQETSTGGRRPILLKVNHKACHVIVFRLTSTELIAGRVNLALEVEETKTRSILKLSPEKILELFLQLYDEILEEESRIAAVCIGVRSLTYLHNTRVSISTTVSSEYITLEEAIRYSLNVPVIVERAANLAALGELDVYGNNYPYYYLDLDREIQLGGVPFIYDEYVAHMKVSQDGPYCHCGKKGCLESFVSTRVVEEQLQGVVPKEYIEWNNVRELYYQKPVNSDIKQVLTQVSNYLGTGLVNIATVLKPSGFILGGSLSSLREPLLKLVRTAVQKQGFYEIDNINIVLAKKDSTLAFLQGGAKNVVTNMFEEDLV